VDVFISMFVYSEEERSCKPLLQLQNTISDFNYWKFVGFLKQIYLTSTLKSKKPVENVDDVVRELPDA
jgi:hypothetical protein